MQFSSYFYLNSDIHDHYTRSYQNYHMQSIETDVRKFSIKIRGPAVYNNVPSYIKEVSSVRRKMLLKTNLLGK